MPGFSSIHKYWIVEALISKIVAKNNQNHEVNQDVAVVSAHLLQ